MWSTPATGLDDDEESDGRGVRDTGVIRRSKPATSCATPASSQTDRSMS